MIAKPAAINPMPREYIVQDPLRREIMAPYPTPQEAPTQQQPFPSVPRPANGPVESRLTESPKQRQPVPAESQPTNGHGESRPTELPRQRQPVPSESRSANGHIEPRSTAHRSVEPRHTERYIEPRPVESRPVQPIAARPIYDEPAPIEAQQQPTVPTIPADRESNHQAEHTSEAPVVPTRQEKRKALDSPQVDKPVVGVPNSKRPRTRDRLDEELQEQSPLKRSPRTRRSSQAILETGIERTIHFDEVYQDGKAQFKHKIFEWKAGSGNWYIVRCDEHQVHFGFGNPVHGAAKHVHSPQHGNMEKKHDLAIEVCGHRVLGCDAELAELNNREFERAVKEDKYRVFNMNLLTKEGRRRLTDGPGEIQNDDNSHAKRRPKPPPKSPEEFAVPEECKFYQGFWQPTKKWYMLIILPIRPDGNLREVGLREKLQETDLMGNIPKCYRVDRVSLQIKGWQTAYEDGGPKVPRRDYPVMFFDSYKKHSVGWVGAQKLRAVDLDSPPEDVDKRGLQIAREWYSQHMMHRKSWEDLKKLGPGAPPSATSSNGEMERNGRSIRHCSTGTLQMLTSPDQWPSLRSAHTDDRSPIRDKSSGPGHFTFGSSSEDGSDDEDPMTMDIGPIPEAVDSNYVAESGIDDSDVEMQDAQKSEDEENENENDVICPGRRRSQLSSRPNSRRGVGIGKDAPAKSNETGTWAEPPKRIESDEDRLDEETRVGPPTPATTDGGDQRDLSSLLSEQEHLRKSAQAKAAAAVMEAATRSRASSEMPENPPRVHSVPSQPLEPQARPESSSRPLMDHHRSRSEDKAWSNGGFPFASHGMSKLSEGRKPSDLHNILNRDQGHVQPIENRADPYKRFEAIKAQMDGLQKNRSASAPVHEGDSVEPPFSPPLTLSAPPRDAARQSPLLSHIMSPPSRSPTMVAPRSSSSTPVPESGRNTPMVTIPVPSNAEKWQVMRGLSSAPPQQSQTARAAFVNMAPVDSYTNGHSGVAPKTAPRAPHEAGQLPFPTPQLGTPIPEKQEFFDISQFRDMARGVRWSRDSASTPFLRLNANPMRGWAETPSDSPLTVAVEPLKIARIEVETLAGDMERQKVRLLLKDGTEQMLMFETKSANGRTQGGAVQGRRFASWVKRVNGEVKLHNGYA